MTPPNESAIQKLADRLLEYSEPTVNWCGSAGCLHRNYEHGLDNACLVCNCTHFSSRTKRADLCTAIRLVMP